MNRRAKYPAFAAEWDRALKEGIEVLEAACWQRAAFGWKKPIWQRNKAGDPVKVDEETLFDGRLAEFLLKAHDPKYTPKVQQELTGPGGIPLVTPIIPTQVTFNIPNNFRNDPAHQLKDAEVKQLPPGEPEKP
jgi:hypothetical protein